MMLEAGQPNDAHAGGNGMKRLRDPLHPIPALLVIVLMDVDMIPKIFVEIVRPIHRALTVGRSHEVQPGQGVGIFLAFGDMYFRCERGGL
jgi:hypothetical protein